MTMMEENWSTQWKTYPGATSYRTKAGIKPRPLRQEAGG